MGRVFIIEQLMIMVYGLLIREGVMVIIVFI